MEEDEATFTSDKSPYTNFTSFCDDVETELRPLNISTDTPEPYDPEKWEISPPDNRNDSVLRSSVETPTFSAASTSACSQGRVSQSKAQPALWSLCMDGDEDLVEVAVVKSQDPEPMLLDLTLDDDSNLELTEANETASQNVIQEGDEFKQFISEEGITKENLYTSFDQIEEKRQAVRATLNKTKEYEEAQLKKFTKIRRFCPASRIFPPLRCSPLHTITFFLQDHFNPKTDTKLKPHPKMFLSKWTPEFVPMPCCPQNERVKIKLIHMSRTNTGGVIQAPKTVKTEEKIGIWNLVQELLSRRIDSCEDLNERINRITDTSENFNVLKYAILEGMPPDEGYNFFDSVLPFMVKLCLDLPNILTCPVPLLRRYKNHSISFTQLQIASLLANAFFCTFPARLNKDECYPSINFNELFTCDPDDSRLQAKAQKLLCILHYFERLSKEKEVHNGIVTFTRKTHLSVNLPNWTTSTKKLTNLVTLCNGTIETDGAGLLQVDFANKYVGGGVLGRGAVQEEILFVIYPELMISRIFTERLFPAEALLVTGCERFSNYYGYSSSFSFAGSFHDSTPFDNKGRRQSQIVAIDALYVRKTLTQFNPQLMERELNKAFVGFSFPGISEETPVAVASGKWGCGAFNGNPELKALLQLMAATESGRDLVLFTFGDSEFQETLTNLYESIKDKTVGEIWSYLKQYYSVFCSTNEFDDQPVGYSLSQFIFECLKAADLELDDFCALPEPGNQNFGENEAQPEKSSESEALSAKFSQREVKFEKPDETDAQPEESSENEPQPDNSDEIEPLPERYYENELLQEKPGENAEPPESPNGSEVKLEKHGEHEVEFEKPDETEAQLEKSGENEPQPENSGEKELLPETSHDIEPLEEKSGENSVHPEKSNANEFKLETYGESEVKLTTSGESEVKLEKCGHIEVKLETCGQSEVKLEKCCENQTFPGSIRKAPGSRSTKKPRSLEPVPVQKDDVEIYEVPRTSSSKRRCTIIDIADEVDNSNFKPISPETRSRHLPRTPTKNRSGKDEQPSLAALYSSPKAKTPTTPSKIGVLDLDQKQVTFKPLVSEIPDFVLGSSVSTPRKRRFQRIMDFANSDSEDNAGDEASPSSSSVMTAVSDEEFEPIFSSPKKGNGLSKYHSAKRKKFGVAEFCKNQAETE